MGIRKYFVAGALLLMLVLVSAQQGCDMPGMGGQGTQAKKYGLDYSLIGGVDYLSGGGILQQGESFYIGVHLENYDSKSRNGEVCIMDNVADTYGGISSQDKGECKFFNIPAADIVKKETSSLFGKKIEEQVTPGTADVYFPSSGIYSYSGLPVSQQPWSQKFYVSVNYRQSSQATGTVSVPMPGYESITLTQEPAPVVMSATKSIHRLQDSYKVDLEIALKKQSSARIFSADFTQENETYFAAHLAPQPLQCYLTSGEPITGKLSLQNERLIKCSSIVYLSGEAQQAYPLVIALDYGVSVEKQYPFGIKT